MFISKISVRRPVCRHDLASLDRSSQETQSIALFAAGTTGETLVKIVLLELIEMRHSTVNCIGRGTFWHLEF